VVWWSGNCRALQDKASILLDSDGLSRVMPSEHQLPVSQDGDSWCPSPERLDVAILLLVGFPRPCFRRLDLLLLTSCSRASGCLGSLTLITDWSWLTDTSWSTFATPRGLRPYKGHPGTIVSLLLTARWCSPLQVQIPRIQFGLFVLDPLQPPGVLCPLTGNSTRIC